MSSLLQEKEKKKREMETIISKNVPVYCYFLGLSALRGGIGAKGQSTISPADFFLHKISVCYSSGSIYIYIYIHLFYFNWRFSWPYQ